MDSQNYFTWKLVDNTVFERFKNKSLIYSCPSKVRIRKSTKAINKEVKKFKNFKRYQEFVKIKKRILETFKSDITTDESDFDENDYKKFYLSIGTSCVKTNINLDECFQWIHVYKKGLKEFKDKECLIKNDKANNIGNNGTFRNTKIQSNLSNWLDKQSSDKLNSLSSISCVEDVDNVFSQDEKDTIVLQNKSAAIKIIPQRRVKKVKEKEVRQKGPKDLKMNLAVAINAASSKVPTEEDEWDDDFVPNDFQAQSTKIFSNSLIENLRSRKSLSLKPLPIQNELKQPKDSGIDEDAIEVNGRCQNLVNNKKPFNKQISYTKTEIENKQCEQENNFKCSVQITTALEKNQEEFINYDNKMKNKHPVKIIEDKKLSNVYKIVKKIQDKHLKSIVEKNKISEVKSIHKSTDCEDKDSDICNVSNNEYIDSTNKEISQCVKNKVQENNDEYFDLQDNSNYLESSDDDNESNADRNTENEPKDKKQLMLLKNKSKAIKSPILEKQYGTLKKMEMIDDSSMNESDVEMNAEMNLFKKTKVRRKIFDSTEQTQIADLSKKEKNIVDNKKLLSNGKSNNVQFEADKSTENKNHEIVDNENINKHTQLELASEPSSTTADEVKNNKSPAKKSVPSENDPVKNSDNYGKNMELLFRENSRQAEDIKKIDASSVKEEDNMVADGAICQMPYLDENLSKFQKQKRVSNSSEHSYEVEFQLDLTSSINKFTNCFEVDSKNSKSNSNISEDEENDKDDNGISAEAQERLKQVKKLNLLETSESEDSESSSEKNKILNSDNNKMKMKINNTKKQKRESNNDDSDSKNKNKKGIVQNTKRSKSEEKNVLDYTKLFCTDSDIEIEEHKIQLPDDCKKLDIIEEWKQNVSNHGQSIKNKKEVSLKNLNKINAKVSNGSLQETDIKNFTNESQVDYEEHLKYKSEINEKSKKSDDISSKPLKQSKHVDLNIKSDNDDDDKDNTADDITFFKKVSAQMTNITEKKHVNSNNSQEFMEDKLDDKWDDDDSNICMSPSAAKKLSQYKKLNLLDDISSSSEDESNKRKSTSQSKSEKSQTFIKYALTQKQANVSNSDSNSDKSDVPKARSKSTIPEKYAMTQKQANVSSSDSDSDKSDVSEVRSKLKTLEMYALSQKQVNINSLNIFSNKSDVSKKRSNSETPEKYDLIQKHTIENHSDSDSDKCDVSKASNESKSEKLTQDVIFTQSTPSVSSNIKKQELATDKPNNLASQDLFSSMENLIEVTNKDNLDSNAVIELEKSLEIDSQEIPLNQEQLKQKRIKKIFQLVEKDNLSEAAAYESTITLNDISDNEEIFLLDVPKYVFNKDLKNKLFSFSRTTLKLGDDKYEAFQRRTVPTISCIFKNEEKSKNSFKAFNIRPITSIVARKLKISEDKEHEDYSTSEFFQSLPGEIQNKESTLSAQKRQKLRMSHTEKLKVSKDIIKDKVIGSDKEAKYKSDVNNVIIEESEEPCKINMGEPPVVIRNFKTVKKSRTNEKVAKNKFLIENFAKKSIPKKGKVDKPLKNNKILKSKESKEFKTNKKNVLTSFRGTAKQESEHQVLEDSNSLDIIENPMNAKTDVNIVIDDKKKKEQLNEKQKIKNESNIIDSEAEKKKQKRKFLSLNYNLNSHLIISSDKKIKDKITEKQEAIDGLNINDANKVKPKMQKKKSSSVESNLMPDAVMNNDRRKIKIDKVMQKADNESSTNNVEVKKKNSSSSKHKFLELDLIVNKEKKEQLEDKEQISNEINKDNEKVQKIIKAKKKVSKNNVISDVLTLNNDKNEVETKQEVEKSNSNHGKVDKKKNKKKNVNENSDGKKKKRKSEIDIEVIAKKKLKTCEERPEVKLKSILKNSDVFVEKNEDIGVAVASPNVNVNKPSKSIQSETPKYKSSEASKATKKRKEEESKSSYIDFELDQRTKAVDEKEKFKRARKKAEKKKVATLADQVIKLIEMNVSLSKDKIDSWDSSIENFKYKPPDMKNNKSHKRLALISSSSDEDNPKAFAEQSFYVHEKSKVDSDRDEKESSQPRSSAFFDRLSESKERKKHKKKRNSDYFDE